MDLLARDEHLPIKLVHAGSIDLRNWDVSEFALDNANDGHRTRRRQQRSVQIDRVAAGESLIVPSDVTKVIVVDQS